MSDLRYSQELQIADLGWAIFLTTLTITPRTYGRGFICPPRQVSLRRYGVLLKRDNSVFVFAMKTVETFVEMAMSTFMESAKRIVTTSFTYSMTCSATPRESH